MLDRFFFSRHLEEDEHVRVIVHKHWLQGLRVLFWPSVSFLFSWVVLALVADSPALLAIVALWSCASIVWWLRGFFDYYLDAWIITDQGIIDLAWHGWFHRQSTRVLYSDIQGVSYEIQGVVGTLVRYGTVNVEKISTGGVMSLSHVPRPRSVEGAILKNMEAYLHSKNLKDAKRVQELLADFVATKLQVDEFEDESV